MKKLSLIYSSMAAFIATALVSTAHAAGEMLELPVALTGDETVDGFFDQISNTATHIAAEYGWALMLTVFGIFWLYYNVRKSLSATAK